MMPKIDLYYLRNISDNKASAFSSKITHVFRASIYFIKCVYALFDMKSFKKLNWNKFI